MRQHGRGYLLTFVPLSLLAIAPFNLGFVHISRKCNFTKKQYDDSHLCPRSRKA